MQRLLSKREADQIDARLHDNALLQSCREVWRERSEEVISAVVSAEDIFCETAWLADRLIVADKEADTHSLTTELWSDAIGDIARWGAQVSLTDRYLIVSTIFHLVATAFSLHWESHYSDSLRDALLRTVDEKRPAPKDLYEQQQLQRLQDALLEACIACSDKLDGCG